eukprot:124307-Rhodomonas_salina.6
MPGTDEGDRRALPGRRRSGRRSGVEATKQNADVTVARKSRRRYFTLEIRGLTSKAINNTMNVSPPASDAVGLTCLSDKYVIPQTVVIGHVCDLKGVWAEIGHTEVVTKNLSPVFKHAFRVQVRKTLSSSAAPCLVLTYGVSSSGSQWQDRPICRSVHMLSVDRASNPGHPRPLVEE